MKNQKTFYTIQSKINNKFLNIFAWAEIDKRTFSVDSFADKNLFYSSSFVKVAEVFSSMGLNLEEYQIIEVDSFKPIICEGEEVSISDMIYGVVEGARELIEQGEASSEIEAKIQAIDDIDSDMAAMVEWSPGQRRVVLNGALNTEL